MNEELFDYVVAFYFGPRRFYPKECHEDKFYFLRNHVNFLKSYKNKNISNAVFMVNKTSDEEVLEVENLLKDHLESGSINGINFRLIFRNNSGISYGGYNEYMLKSIKGVLPTDAKYYFCLEDDYIPATDDFVFPFMKKCNDQFPYVCQIADPEDFALMTPPRQVPNPVMRHPGCTTGIWLKEACEKVHQEKFNILCIPDHLKSPAAADGLQMGIFNHFLEMDLGDFVGMGKEPYEQPFQQSTAPYGVTLYGKVGGKRLITINYPFEDGREIFISASGSGLTKDMPDHQW